MSQPFLLPSKSAQRFTAVITEKPVLSFLLFWTLLNLAQVSLMELTSDEGYYWFYAQHLQWGYYDHPPMIALLIKAGSFLLPGELGVRFFNVVASTGGLLLFLSLLPQTYRHNRITYWVMLAAPLLHYLTFLLFPDGPLLFFSMLYLVMYRKFLKKANLLTAIFLGLSLALMAYAKYHGALVLVFTVLAYPKLLKSLYFYVALVVALVLFVPHLWWQYQNNFPTFHYHLSGRTGSWGFRHVGEYLSQQLVAIGPGLIFIPFVCKAKDVFERTLKVIILGTFGFFFFTSFKTFVHFHWTSIALYPLLYFAVQYYQQPQKRKLFYWLVLPFAGLFFVARFLLLVPFIPAMHVGEDYYHGREAWANELAALAGDRPVFMPNNLREVSLYRFYTGKPGVTLYNRPEKKSQYELWGYEDSLQGKSVLFVDKYPFTGSQPVQTALGKTEYYAIIPSFQSYYSGLAINEVNRPPQPIVDSSWRVALSITNKRAAPIHFKTGDSAARVVLIYQVKKGKDVLYTKVMDSITIAASLKAGKRMPFTGMVSLAGLPPGGYEVYFGLRYSFLPDAVLSPPIPIRMQ